MAAAIHGRELYIQMHVLPVICLCICTGIEVSYSDTVMREDSERSMPCLEKIKLYDKALQ
jgi:hypothetical protein